MATTVRPEAIQQAVRQMFDRVAGPDLARRVGYPDEMLAAVPPHSADAFTGLVYLHTNLRLRPGEAALDLGCGRGLDCFIAALAVGPTGSVTGLDLSEAMIERATFDLVYANGILNLCPDKERVVREMHRVMKRGARAVVAEITFTEALTECPLRTTDDWFR